VLTLSGSSSIANYQTALRSVSFRSTAAGPSRTVSFKVNDGSLDSNAATKGIDVTAAPGAPVVTTSSGSTGYTENDPPTVVDGSVAVADSDSVNLQSGRVRISAGFETTDALSFTNQSGITGSYDSATGVLTLTGSATVANYQAALRSVKFSSSSDNPATAKTVEFTVNDGGFDSNAATKNIAITRVDDPPHAVDDSAQVAQDSGASSVDVLANDSDVDGGPKQVASVTQPVHGSVAIGSGGANVSYTPAAGYCNNQQGGSPDTFTYTVNGGSQATVSMTVTCAGTAARPTVTVTKRLSPSTDAGRFDLKVNGATVAAGAGDGGHGSAQVDSGSDVTVSEAAANGHDLSGYTSTIDCGAAGSGTGTSLTLTAVKADTSCTITNTLRSSPPPAATLVITHRDTSVARGGTRIRLACHGARGGRCEGTLTLESTGFTTRLHHAASGTIRFNLATGKGETVRIPVPARTQAQLAAHHRAIARLVAKLSGGETLRLLLTLFDH
jgi:hypothetical protein